MLAWLGVGRCGLNSTKKNLSRRFFALSSVICHSLSFVARKIKINNDNLRVFPLHFPFPIPCCTLEKRRVRKRRGACCSIFSEVTHVLCSLKARGVIDTLRDFVLSDSVFKGAQKQKC